MPIVCYNASDTETNETIFDKTVIESIGIKIWHLAFMIFACAVIVTIVLCCIFRCRVPRTRQEIEADIVRNRVTKTFRKHLEKLPYDNLCLLGVLNQVQTMEEARLKSGVEEKSYTMVQRFKLWLYSSKEKGTNESGSFEKQASIEMVKKPSQSSLSNKSMNSLMKA